MLLIMIYDTCKWYSRVSVLPAVSGKVDMDSVFTCTAMTIFSVVFTAFGSHVVCLVLRLHDACFDFRFHFVQISHAPFTFSDIRLWVWLADLV